MTEVEDIIEQLELAPHPEGGYYRETFRDTPRDGSRARSTAILFLLKAGEVSRWHRVDAVEVWHWYAGDPLQLSQSVGDGVVVIETLGNNILQGEQPQLVVPANIWQSAKTLGSYTLVGCTVAPGFRFEGFELAPEGWTP